MDKKEQDKLILLMKKNIKLTEKFYQTQPYTSVSTYVTDNELKFLQHRLAYMKTWIDIVFSKRSDEENKKDRQTWSMVITYLTDLLNQYQTKDFHGSQFEAHKRIIVETFRQFKEIDEIQQRGGMIK